MSESQFIGRGEELTKNILAKLLDCRYIDAQVNIRSIIGWIQYDMLDPEIRKHNFDLVIGRNRAKDIVVEVNYKHKEKAAKKWRLILVPLITKAGYDYMTIDHYDCRSSLKRTLGLFHLNSKKEHEKSWNDYRDVIDALEKAGVKP